LQQQPHGSVHGGHGIGEQICGHTFSGHRVQLLQQQPHGSVHGRHLFDIRGQISGHTFSGHIVRSMMALSVGNGMT
jgi:hypothetical protein